MNIIHRLDRFAALHYQFTTLKAYSQRTCLLIDYFIKLEKENYLPEYLASRDSLEGDAVPVARLREDCVSPPGLNSVQANCAILGEL